MTDASPTALLPRASSQQQSLLAGMRAHLLDVLRAEHARDVYVFHLVPEIAATVAGADLPGLLAQPGVRAIELDQWHRLVPTSGAASVAHGAASVAHAAAAAGTGPNGVRRVVDVAQTVEPESFDLTGAQVAQAHGYDGAGVRVAIIDSGIDVTQPDLAGLLATDAHGAPLRVDFTGTDLQDTVGHGTACASLIAAQGRVLYTADTLFQARSAPPQIYPVPTGPQIVYRSHFHVYGMARGVRLLSAKIFDTRVPNGGGYDSWIVRAIEWAVDHHADVISESFGGTSVPSNGTDAVAQADEAAVRAGITVVAANGNTGPGQTTVGSPADAPGVIAAGASTDYRHFGQTGVLAQFGRTTSDNVASFTSRGPTTDGRPRPDLVAPGAFSWALFPMKKSEDGPEHPPYDVGTFGGTSMATPVTAGGAALVIEAFRKAHGGASPSPALVRSILMSSAHDLGYPAFDQGAGRLDAWEAVQTAVHSGPAFLLRPNSLAISGPVAAPFHAAFTLTNAGNTVQRYTMDAVHSHLAGIEGWEGTIRDAALAPFHFTVRPGLERIVGAVYWNSADRFLVKGKSNAVFMRVALYDPLGRFANFSNGQGSGFAQADVVHPMPGTWTLVVSERGRMDPAGIRHFTRERFQARLFTYVSQPYGTFSPTAVTLGPGQSAPITFAGRTPVTPGADAVTVHVHGDHTAVLPVALTSYITLYGSSARFGGTFTGPSNDYYSLSNENKVFSLNVPPGTHALNIALTWPHPGYGVVLLLMDPSGEIVDGQFNGIGNGNPTGPFDLSTRYLQAIWSNPTPGRWQIIVMDAIFAGHQAAEPFRGRVTLGDNLVRPRALTRTVVPGDTFDINLQVRNASGPNVAEGYIGYATTDSYSKIPLGTISGPFGNSSHIAGSDVYTYKTRFVPPGTRTVVSSVAVIHPSVAADLAFADPIGFARAEGEPALVRIGGQTYQGSSATVTGSELPIGPWFAEVTLRHPNTHVHASIVARSYADALTPLSWITFDHGLQNGRITGGQPLILLPGQHDVLHASATVPLSMQPGTYHVRLFVYTVFGDQVAQVPLTVVVEARTGTEPS
jgi:subtilisin family serine protease